MVETRSTTQSSLAKRIIPCLDIKGGRTVKGTKFQNLRDAGDPAELARRYSAEGADELVFLDISATDEERSTTLDVVTLVARAISIPFTVGGGITSVRDVSRLLSAGADKISINSSAVRNPELITAIAKEFGSQCVVVAIDTKIVDGTNRVHIQAGKVPVAATTTDWAKQVVERGAGEILLTSMDHDGTRNGFAVELTRTVSNLVSVPVIASGGAGSPHDFVAVLESSDAAPAAADAALAAGIFHDGIVSIAQVKRALAASCVPVRFAAEVTDRNNTK
jgi:cyclase